IPAKAGTQADISRPSMSLGPRFRGDERKSDYQVDWRQDLSKGVARGRRARPVRPRSRDQTTKASAREHATNLAYNATKCHKMTIPRQGSRMNRTIAVGRKQQISQLLDVAGAVSVSDLAGKLGVSRETIRRDLKLLAGEGRVNLVHGGAALANAGE